MYFNGLIQELSGVPRYLLNYFSEVPEDEYDRSERAFLCRGNWLCADRKLFSVALAAHKDAVRLSHWIGSQHWPFLKNMVPRRFALARMDGICIDQFNDQYLDYIGEKIHIPLFGRTTIGHAELGETELELFKAYRFNDRFPTTIAVEGNTPVVHLVFMFAPASIAYFKSTALVSETKAPTDLELIQPANLIYVPA